MNENYIESVAAYIRVSTPEQKLHGLSLEAQTDKLTEYALQHNLKIYDWYKDEGVSGRKLIKNRPQLQRMIKDAQKGYFTRIIFIKLDRFFRSVGEYHECMKQISPVIWTATEEKYDLSTANGRAFVNMKLTIAELEADQTAERVRIVNDYKVKSGLPLSGSRLYPFCYEVRKDAENSRHKALVKAPDYIDTMNDLIAYVESTGSVRLSMERINDKYGLNLTYRQIMTALKSPLICGTYRDNPQYCEAYITPERFDKLQQIITKNFRTTDKRDYLFTGLLICPMCGRRLAASQHTASTQNGKYIYHYSVYRCPAHRINKRCDFAGCVFENAVENMLLEKLPILFEAEKAKINGISPDAAPKKYNLDALNAELDRLNYAWQKGRIPDAEEYDRKYNELIKKITAAKAENQAEASRSFEAAEKVLVSGWQEIYNSLDAEHKRSFWRSFISEIHLKWKPGKHGSKEITDIMFY